MRRFLIYKLIKFLVALVIITVGVLLIPAEQQQVRICFALGMVALYIVVLVVETYLFCKKK